MSVPFRSLSITNIENCVQSSEQLSNVCNRKNRPVRTYADRSIIDFAEKWATLRARAVW